MAKKVKLSEFRRMTEREKVKAAQTAGGPSRASVRSAQNTRGGEAWQNEVLGTATLGGDLFLFRVPDPMIPEGRDWKTGRKAANFKNGAAMCRRGASVWVDLSGYVARGDHAGVSVQFECKATSGVTSWPLLKRFQESQGPRLVRAGRCGCVAAALVRRDTTGDRYVVPWPVFAFLDPLPSDAKHVGPRASVSWDLLEPWRVPARSLLTHCVVRRGVWMWGKYLSGGWSAL